MTADAPSQSQAPAYRLATRCVVPPEPRYHDQYGSSQIPVYLTSTFKGGDGAAFD